MDGDGKIDLLLYSVGKNSMDSAAVYVLFSDGSGGFTPSAMQLLSGRGWHGGSSLCSPSATSPGTARTS
jgi:hypothetical protein